ncbi:AMME syndrome candidate protein 1 protein [Linnemannia elongata]|nr:AMME syndrome candidate protein 1 protein [Linnemannia elongata]
MSKEHCYYCFDSLVAYFDGRPVSPPTFDDSPFPLFVTWSTSEDGTTRDLRLRGCIGNFSAMPLHSGLKEYALTSAFKDGRFPPIDRKELSSLVGRHGIWIEFKDARGRKKTATYLPEVAKEQGWTKEKAIESLLRKGGYREAISQEFLDSVILTRYQSRKGQVTYQDYVDTL